MTKSSLGSVAGALERSQATPNTSTACCMPCSFAPVRGPALQRIRADDVLARSSEVPCRPLLGASGAGEACVRCFEVEAVVFEAVLLFTAPQVPSMLDLHALEQRIRAAAFLADVLFSACSAWLLRKPVTSSKPWTLQQSLALHSAAKRAAV